MSEQQGDGAGGDDGDRGRGPDRPRGARARVGRRAHGSRRRRRARADAPLRRARPGRGGAGPVPRHEARDRAGHRRRLLLRLPAAPPADARRPARDRGADAREHRRRPPVRAERAVAGRGARVRGRARPAVQGRDHRRPARRGGARRHARCRRRPSTARVRSSTCAAARTWRAPARSGRSSCSAPPARTGAATRSARCSSASTARPGRPRRSSTQYLWRREEAKKRDHRRLGVQLDLFSFHDVAPGSAFWHPKGQVDLAHARRARCASSRPGAATRRSARRSSSSERLWRQSGHWDLYKENMFIVESENQLFSLKPMNCPEIDVHLPVASAVVPRPAAALQRVRPAPSQRAVRHVERADPRPPVHPGRRAPVRPPGPADGRDPGAARRGPRGVLAGSD